MKEIEFDVSGGEKRVGYTVNCADASVDAITSASWLQVRVDSSLFTITAGENTGSDRRAYVIPTLNGEYCDTSTNKLSVFQKGVSTGCSTTLVISGLKNDDKAAIDWGDETTSEDRKNGTYRHRYTSGDEHTVIVTAEGYDTATGTFVCGNTTKLEIEMKTGGTPVSQITVSFSLTNRTSSSIYGTVEVFWENMDNSFSIPISSSIAPGITEYIGSATISGNAKNKQIVAAYLQNPSIGSASLFVTGSRTLVDNGNYNLEYQG